jgi:hypothetical protein
VVTLLQVHNPITHLFNHPCALVAQDDWKRNSTRGVDHCNIRMANARSHHTYPDLIVAWFFEFNLFDLKGFTILPADSN